MQSHGREREHPKALVQHSDLRLLSLLPPSGWQYHLASNTINLSPHSNLFPLGSAKRHDACAD